MTTAKTSAPQVTRAVPDDGPGFVIGLILFTALIPVLFFVSWYLSPLDHVSPETHTTAPAAPAAEPAPAAP
jgi:hypothetical protein